VAFKLFAMKISYVTDYTGNTIAVQIPIEDWNLLKKQYPGMEAIQEGLPQWQKDIIDKRLMLIKQGPDSVIPMEDFIAEMEKEADEEI